MRGLGVWTAHMFLIYLEREDVLPVGDLGIRNAIKAEYGNRRAATPEEMEPNGQYRRPHRTLALPLPLGVLEQYARVAQRRPLERPRWTPWPEQAPLLARAAEASSLGLAYRLRGDSRDC